MLGKHMVQALLKENETQAFFHTMIEAEGASWASLSSSNESVSLCSAKAIVCFVLRVRDGTALFLLILFLPVPGRPVITC